MEPRESSDTSNERATGRKGAIWKLFAYFLVLSVVTFAANQVVIRYKDVAQAEGLVKISAMIGRTLDVTGKFDDTVVTLWSLLLTALLVLPIGWVYAITKSREVYDQSLVKTLLVMGMVVCGMMMLIQDQFSRALALVAVVSAIRFRTTLKDPNDAVFLLVSIAIGMGAGLGVFRVATLFTIFMSLTFLLLWRFRIGEQPAHDEGFFLGREGGKHKKKKKDKKEKKERERELASSEGSAEEASSAAVVADSATEPVTPDRER